MDIQESILKKHVTDTTIFLTGNIIISVLPETKWRCYGPE